MKQRIVKLKSRKGKVDQGIKLCKQCGQEYHEKENFNWSCRTHAYEYGGEIWWCCGKRGKDQPGCKFSKHVSKEDDDEDEEFAGEKGKGKNLKYARCLCCKELGHLIEDCPRDPNIKTRPLDFEHDFQRILKISDFKKLYADTAVTTTHFLKKCVKVPKIIEKSAENPEGMTAVEAEK